MSILREVFEKDGKIYLAEDVEFVNIIISIDDDGGEEDEEDEAYDKLLENGWVVYSSDLEGCGEYWEYVLMKLKSELTDSDIELCRSLL